LAEHYAEASAFLCEADPDFAVAMEPALGSPPAADRTEIVVSSRAAKPPSPTLPCCLVHCSMGVNRSAAVVVAYLIDIKKVPLLVRL
jgi:hypothetical protein